MWGHILVNFTTLVSRRLSREDFVIKSVVSGIIYWQNTVRSKQSPDTIRWRDINWVLVAHLGL